MQKRLLSTYVGEKPFQLRVGHGVPLREVAQGSAKLTVRSSILRNDNRRQFWIGVLDSDRVLQLFFIDKHLIVSLLFREIPRPGIVQPAVGLVLAGAELGQRTVLRLPLFF